MGARGGTVGHRCVALAGLALLTATACVGRETSADGPATRPFARDDVEREHLVDDGFEIGHVALFLPPDSVNGATPLTNDSVIVQGIAGLFHDADGAGSSLERYVEDLRSRQVPGAIDVPADGLGEQSFGLRGQTPDGADVQIFAWRIENLLLVISGSGRMTSEQVRGLADVIDGRT